MNIEKCHTITVSWDTTEQLWAVTWKDSNGASLDIAEFYETKQDAIDMARAYRDSDRCTHLSITQGAA